MVQRQESESERIFREVKETQARLAARKAQQEGQAEIMNAMVAELSAATDAVCERFDNVKARVSSEVDKAAVRAQMQIAMMPKPMLNAMWAGESKHNKEVVKKLGALMKPAEAAQ